MAEYYNEIVPIFETSELTVARGKNNSMTLVGRLPYFLATSKTSETSKGDVRNHNPQRAPTVDSYYLADRANRGCDLQPYDILYAPRLTFCRQRLAVHRQHIYLRT